MIAREFKRAFKRPGYSRPEHQLFPYYLGAELHGLRRSNSSSEQSGERVFPDSTDQAGHFQFDSLAIDNIEVDKSWNYLPPVHFSYEQVPLKALMLFDHSQLNDSVKQALSLVEEFGRQCAIGQGGDQS